MGTVVLTLHWSGTRTDTGTRIGTYTGTCSGTGIGTGSRVGSGFRDRTPAVKSRKTPENDFLVKKYKFLKNYIPSIYAKI